MLTTTVTADVYHCPANPADELTLGFWDNAFQEANDLMHIAHSTLS